MAERANSKRKIITGWMAAELMFVYRLGSGIVVQPLQLVLMAFYTVLLALLAMWKLHSLRRQVRSALT